ncbi:hypothetical protein DICPUDRAFT_75856 [Dictyostelium purpureum]|uniref:TOG domain-containing protein n=1 Tax=Dictyostelium purpureum TaxID=5786 RepID=F0ZBV5_DICPU|nr:uncharacterized protein DICPUDRAFT_75856 [Dictyostelium purpureum]EGC38551.1 hypothetical protein DICPUDRAFT_75856 [Dictyostelium purpureum]|eukprot:XP_003284922.1 hypothetical protein DICPUDRAFT_75856 [Dictyostelium purpureum]
MDKGIKEIINKLCSKNDEDQDDIINISRGYRLLLNFMKSNILEGKDLITISTLIIKHLKKDNNEIIIIKVLECSNYLIDFLIDVDSNEKEKEEEEESIKSIDILNQLIQILFCDRLIGNNDGYSDVEGLQKEILDNVQGVVSSIINSFGFSLVLEHLTNSLNSSNDHLLIENCLKILCNLIESSTIQSTQLSRPLQRLIVSLLKYPQCQFYPSLYKAITLIINEMGHQFLNEIDYDNQDSSIKKIILKLLEYDQEKKKKQNFTQDQMDCSNDSNINNNSDNSNNNNENEDWENSSSTSINSNNNNNKVIANKNNIKSYKTLNNKNSEEEDVFSKLAKRKPLGIQLLCENLNESELEYRMNEIIEALDNSETEWNIKLNNVLKLQSLIKSGACKLSNFTQLLNKIKDLLIAQVLDKRSILMKEACLTVSAIAEALEHQFEPFVDRFFNALVKCIISTIKVVSETSDNCIKCIISSIKSCKIIPRLYDLLEKDKSTTVRSKSAEYLLILLRDSPLNQLERFLDYIEKSIRIGIVDAHPTARSTSRQLFFQYSINWPSKSNQLFKSLDPNSQKQIQKEQQQHQPSIKINNNKATTISTKKGTSTTTPNLSKTSPSLKPSLSPSTSSHPTFQLGKPTVIKKSSLPSSLKIKENSPKPPLIIHSTTTTKPTLPVFSLTPTPLLNPTIIKKKPSISPLKNNISTEKKRSITSVFTEASTSTTTSTTASILSRKKQMLTHPTSPSYSKVLNRERYIKDSDNDDDDFVLENNNLLKNSLLGSPKKIKLDKDDKNLNSLGSPKRTITSSPKKFKTTTISPKKTITTSSSSLTTNNIFNPIKLITTKPPVPKTTSKPFSSLTKKNGAPLKNYVKDIMTYQQGKSQQQQSKELKLTDLYN